MSRLPSVAMKFRLFLSLLLLIVAFPAVAQLSNFTLTLIPKDETCTGNGGVTITTSNTTPGATMSFQIQSMPGQIPIENFTSNVYAGLSAGSYRIVATQTQGSDTGTQTADFNVQDEIIPLVWSFSEPPAGNCANSGNILFDVSSGTPPFTFEILSGPEIRPLQTSGLFSNLPPGQYLFRISDACKGEPFTFTLVPQVNTLALSTSGDVLAPNCLSIDVNNAVTPTGVIVYPLNVTYEVHYPNSTTQTLQQVYGNGSPDSLQLSLTLPLFGAQTYTYDLTVVDGCGNSFTGNFTVDPNPKASLTGTPNNCGHEYLSLIVNSFVGQYTVSFTNAPPGFDPAALNGLYPGPTDQTVLQFGDEDHPVPEGMYEVLVTDNCGRTGTTQWEVVLDELDPNVRAGVPNCLTNLANIRFQVAADRDIVSIIVVSAPPEYTPALPNDISPATPQPSITVSGFPPNPTIPYVFNIIDECGITYSNVDVIVRPFVPDPNLQTDVRPSCAETFGSMRLGSANGNLTSLTITDAPPNFPSPIPFDATSLIVSGSVFLEQLPPGNYSFSGLDSCNVALTATNIAVVGYDSGANNVLVQRNCGSFNFTITDNGNIPGVSYWFQRQDPVSGTWAHPFNGTPYTEGITPDSSNSVLMANGGTLNNLTVTGTFRIVKVYQTYSASSTDCLDIWDTFSFTNGLDILGIYNLDCNGGAAGSIYIEAVGVPPYTFSITGPVNIQNGGNNIFTGLLPGTYSLTVVDACQATIPARTVNLSTLESLVVANEPSPRELLLCAPPGTTSNIFDITELESSILGTQNPADYDVTYHHSLQDAQSGDNKIDTPQAYVNTQVIETIYVRVIHKRIDVCYATTSFRLIIGEAPDFTLSQTQYFVCAGSSVRLEAGMGYDAYLWSDGSNAPYLDVTEPGTYSVSVANIYGSSRCDSDSQSITVEGSSVATITSVDVVDWRDDSNSITVNVTGTGDYLYALDDTPYQSSNFFGNLPPGLYTVRVMDQKNNCGIVTLEVPVLGYPKFFTPNGDGQNEFWQIKLAYTQPGMIVYIFDRYAKLLASFGAASTGWDGNYNGQQMPSDDYWFLVELPNGKIHRGHFALKR